MPRSRTTIQPERKLLSPICPPPQKMPLLHPPKKFEVGYVPGTNKRGPKLRSQQGQKDINKVIEIYVHCVSDCYKIEQIHSLSTKFSSGANFFHHPPSHSTAAGSFYSIILKISHLNKRCFIDNKGTIRQAYTFSFLADRTAVGYYLARYCHSATKCIVAPRDGLGS